MDGQANRKSPTIVLLNPKGEFADFGARAQQKFSDLALDGNDKDWYYFRRFKMQLYKNKKINQDMILEDINGREMNACDVFSFCMEYIKNKVYTKASQALAGLKEEQIHWMITVPAIWSDSARQFMIDAAERAGIDRDLLTLVLEPEAAAVYCKHIEIDRKGKGKEACLHVFEPGSQFMVVDLGGGTVDITCNEVLDSKKLREVYSASGGPWGGNMINQRIWKHIRTLFRKEQFDKFIKENTDCQIDLLKAIEEAKMNMKPHQNSVIRIPDYIFEACTYDSNSAEIDAGKRRLVLSSGTVVKVFEACCVQVCRHLKNVLERKENVQIKTMLLVGGYSACEMLKDGIKKAFPNIHIISPVDRPETIVLRGAVLMGHESRPIVRRIAKYHYVLSKPLGLRILSRSTMQEDAVLNDELIYLPLINKGDPLNIGNQIAEYIFVVEAENLQETEIDILSCEDEKPPTSLNENFTKIGKIYIRMPELSVSTEIQVVVSCEETEFTISAVMETGERFNALCNFLL